MDPEGTAHRDYYLLSDARAPLRNGEVETLAEAAAKLKAQTQTSVKVRGVGAVAWVGEMKLASRENVMVLGSQLLDSGARFYFIPESQGRLGTPVIFWPHDLVADHKPSRGTLGADDWTVDPVVSFISRPLYEDQGLTILQVVAKSGGIACIGLVWARGSSCRRSMWSNWRGQPVRQLRQLRYSSVCGRSESHPTAIPGDA